MKGSQHNRRVKDETVRQSVLARIESEHVELTPRYQFLLKEYVLWGLWGASLVIGAASVAALMYSEMSVGWEFYEAIHSDFLTFLVETLPYIWIGLLLAMTAVAYYNLRHTKRGYQYSVSLIIFLCILGSVVGGIILHVSGAGFMIDHTIGRRIPLHRSALMIQEELWSHPESGRVGGVVFELYPDMESVLVESPNGTTFLIDTMELRGPDRRFLQVGKEVRIIGTTSREAVFVACHVFSGEHGALVPSLAEMRERRHSFLQYLKDEFSEDVTDEINEYDERTSVCRSTPFYQRLLDR